MGRCGRSLKGYFARGCRKNGKGKGKGGDGKGKVAKGVEKKRVRRGWWIYGGTKKVGDTGRAARSDISRRNAVWESLVSTKKIRTVAVVAGVAVRNLKRKKKEKWEGYGLSDSGGTDRGGGTRHRPPAVPIQVLGQSSRRDQLSMIGDVVRDELSKIHGGQRVKKCRSQNGTSVAMNAGRSNRFDVLVCAEDVMEIEQVNEVDVVQEIVEVTVVSGAAKSVWQMSCEDKDGEYRNVGSSKRKPVTRGSGRARSAT